MALGYLQPAHGRSCVAGLSVLPAVWAPVQPVRRWSNMAGLLHCLLCGGR